MAQQQSQKFVEVNVYRDYLLRQPMTRPHRGISEIAAGASASRTSPTEAEIRTVCLRVWHCGVRR